MQAEIRNNVRASSVDCRGGYRRLAMTFNSSLRATAFLQGADAR
jgi:hypothetical protein